MDPEIVNSQPRIGPGESAGRIGGGRTVTSPVSHGNRGPFIRNARGPLSGP